MYFSSLSSCSVSPPEDKTWVEIQHNNTEMTRVLFSSEKNQHFAHFNYSSAEEQLAAIISQSEHCEQELSYHCRRSRLLSSIGKILKFNLFLLLFTRFYFWFFFLTTVLMYLKRIVSLSEHKGSFSASVESKETRANSVKNWTSVVNNLPFLKQKVLPKGFHHNFFVCFKISKFAILKSDETEILKRTIFQRIIKSCCKKSPMLCLPVHVLRRCSFELVDGRSRSRSGPDILGRSSAWQPSVCMCSAGKVSGSKILLQLWCRPRPMVLPYTKPLCF